MTSISALRARVQAAVRARANATGFWFVLCFVASKLLVQYKVGLASQYREIADDFFPSWLWAVPTYWLDLPIVGFLLSGSRPLIAAAAGLSLVQIVHPQSFGIQNYVVSFWLLAWYAVRDENDSLRLGRAVVSFLFLGAALGKLTPGWLDGSYPARYLPGLASGLPFQGLLFVAGELVLAIAFLLPVRVGALTSLVVMAGMVASLSPLVLNVIGPAVGVNLMALRAAETRDPAQSRRKPKARRPRALLVVAMSAYVLAALLAPQRLYVDRFLMDMSFAEWAALQPAPSMYATEIKIRDETTGRIFSTPHQPMRIFYEDRSRQPQCASYTFEVRLRQRVAGRRAHVCNDVLELDPIEGR